MTHDWKPTPEMLQTALDAYEIADEEDRNLSSLIIAVQPLIAAQALENFGVKQNRMLGVVEYTGEMAAIITRIAAQERERIARTVKLYLGADSVIAEAVSSAIRAMGEKEPQG